MKKISLQRDKDIKRCTDVPTFFKKEQVFMEKLRKKCIACIIWLLVLLLGVTCYVFFVTSRLQFMAEDDYLKKDDTYFVATNFLGYGMLYSLDSSSGEVKKILSTRGQAYVDRWQYELISSDMDLSNGEDQYVYALLSKPKAYEEQTVYRIVCYSKGMSQKKVSPTFLIDTDTIVTGFSLEKERFCITAVSEDRNRIIFYDVSPEALVTLKQADDTEKKVLRDEPAKIDATSDEHSTHSRYVEAELAGGALYTRMEGEMPQGHFAENNDVQDLFNRRQMSFIQHYIAAGCSGLIMLVVFAAGCILICGIIELMSLQYRFLNRLIFYEVFLILVMGLLCVVLLGSLRKSYKEVFTRFAFFAMETLDNKDIDFEDRPDVYESDGYRSLIKDLKSIIKNDDGIVPCVDICYIDNSSNEILASIRGYTGHFLTYCYGTKSGEVIQASDEVIQTEEYILISHPVAGKANYTVVFVSNYPSMFTYMLHYGRFLPWLLGVTYLLLSLVGVWVIVREWKDLRLIGDALRELAEGNTTYQKPDEFMGWEMNRLWNSVNEICRNILSINRIQFLTYKAYYRFAPKSIERILKKESITDVNCGDEIQVNGTIVMISSKKKTGLPAIKDGTNMFLEMVDRHRSDQDGIYISSTPDLSMVRLLFLEESGGSVRFGVDLLQEAHTSRELEVLPRLSVLIHYTPIVYGIAGTDNQASAYVSMDREKLFEAYAEWFGRMGIPMVVTDSVCEHEKNMGDLRHIGFILINKDDQKKRIDLYEVLDAEPTNIHNGKQKTSKIFEEGLQLFYQKDFYLARGSFAEILRQMPEDGVAKWYLFECERLLNDATDSEFTGKLHFV